MLSRVGVCLVKADNVCDYIPIVSTVNNLIDLFQKCVVIPFMKQATIASSHYYTHLQQKSFLLCLALAIPGLNVIVKIYVSLAGKNTTKAEVDLQNASVEDRKNPKIVRPALEKNGLNLQYADESIQNNTKAVFIAVRQNGLALRFVENDDLKNDRNIVQAAVAQNGLALQFAGDWQKDDTATVLVAVGQNGLALEHAADSQKNDYEVVTTAVRQNPEALQFASARLQQQLRAAV